MRHRTVLSLALILGLVPALDTPPLASPCKDDECLDKRRVGEREFGYDLDRESDFRLGLEPPAVPQVSPRSERV